MNFLGLTNKVIQEGGSEMDELTLATWSSAEAGRRLYPRYKRAVAEAWKQIQMERNEWEFNTDELNVRVNPRIKFAEGLSLAGTPLPGQQFRGLESQTLIQIVTIDVDPKSPAFTEGGAFGQLEFVVVNDGQSLRHGERMEHVGNAGTSFVYAEKGSYDFFNDSNGVREPRWDTFVGGRAKSFPNPIIYIPWDNWLLKEYSWTGTSQTVPAYVSQDPKGHLCFYPQPLAPFELSFWYDEEPQALVEPTDIPKEIPGEYHEWIAWRALEAIASFDKNPDLFAYANRHTTFYKGRAERNLMPLISWKESAYNRGTVG